MTQSRRPGVLVIEGNHEFEGFLFGAPLGAKLEKDRGYGEIVFNTSMTGYQEILTDPSYFGQMVCLTQPHIGNTGINSQDTESEKPNCAGLIIHDLTQTPSSWRSEGDLDSYLVKNGIPGLSGVDTRALTRHLRTSGVVRGILIEQADRSKAKALLEKVPAFEGRDLILEVSTQKPYLWPSVGPTKYRVVALDFGIKRNLLRILADLGCEIEVLPANTSSKEILEKKPDGIFLSNGPGDPAAATYAHQSVREILGKHPLFGVCMGHQILCHALGGKTYKLKFGHRGANHPVLDQETSKVEISSQNHGYAVETESLPAHVKVTHLNLFDKTVAGMRVDGAQAYSVQYHPEASPGPHDSRPLFDRFIQMMSQAKSG